MASSRSRMSTAIATITVLGGAAGLCWMGATAGAVFIERESLAEVRQALNGSGYDWVQVQTDGLQVRLSGTAPTEVERFRAMTQAGTAVDGNRILDEMTVAAADALTPPDFKIELLRNDDGISLIGLVPASMDRGALLRELRGETAAPKITDLLEGADHPVPPLWDEAIRLGLGATQLAQRAKISISPGAVHVTALADSAREKARMESDLRRAAPAGVALSTDISAPRPVIAPFTLRFLIDDDGARFDACSADDEEGRDRILAAAIQAGVPGKPGCTLGLGAPTPVWADAAVPAIEAVAALGRGSVTISDADIALIAPDGIAQDRFDQVARQLDEALPDVFSLHAELEKPAAVDQGPAEFMATRTADGKVSIRGGLSDARMLDAVDSFARSRFFGVESELRSDVEVPAGWTVKVIAALEALSGLENGAVTVTPGNLRLSGTSGDPRAVDQAAAVLSQRLGAGSKYELSIRYDRRLDATLGLPDGEECVSRLNVVMSESEIGFEPNRSTIAGDPSETLDKLAAIMIDCADFQIEAGGHTDSQGSAGFNADLSRARAQTLVSAMTDAGIDTRHMTSRGYGESQPIATNDTEEGREANRRIEFRLMSPIAVRSEPLPAPAVREGVTTEALAQTAAPEGATAPAEAWQAASGVVARPGATDAPVAFGPVLPLPLIGTAGHVAPGSAGVAPATLGVSEQVEAGMAGGLAGALPILDILEENLTLPVLVADENTPRPARRPAENEAAENGAAGNGAEEDPEAGAEAQ
ncbi:OmpA family protein [Paracoccus siganidrum]|uniref:OmpA family protein n=2 Tax=Paracoccus siganidrum TaxID=1276757 RepID=UPI001981DA4A|nr:OmpA family protein [Paracoccus siganidrum]